MKKFNYNIPGEVYFVSFSDDELSIRIRTYNESVKNELSNFHYTDYKSCFELFKWLLRLKRKGYKIEYYNYCENDILEILKELKNISIQQSMNKYSEDSEVKEFVTKDKYRQNLENLYSF